MKKLACGSAVFLIWTLLAAADEWPAAKVLNIFSDNGRYFVRVVPGKSLGDLVGFEGSAKGPYAHGEFYALQSNRSYKLVADVTLQNPVNPVDAMVTNNGYLITFDNWHNAGYGKIAAMYNPNGKLIRAFTLEELYSQERLREIPRSVSSRWWRCTSGASRGYSDPDKQTTVYNSEHFGGTFAFKVQNGSFEYYPGHAECQK